MVAVSKRKKRKDWFKHFGALSTSQRIDNANANEALPVSNSPVELGTKLESDFQCDVLSAEGGGNL